MHSDFTRSASTPWQSYRTQEILYKRIPPRGSSAFIKMQDYANNLIANSIAEIPFLDGFESEKLAIKNLHTNCNHHQYSSIEKFISEIDKLHKLRKKSSNNCQYDRITKSINELIGKGFCKQCCLYIIVNISELSGCNGHTLMTTDLRTYDGTRLAFHSWSTISTMNSYFSQCLRYHHLAKFIFDQSMLWVYVFNILQGCIAEINEQSKYIPETSNTGQNVEYEKLSHLLIQIVRNIVLMKKNHWKAILRKDFVYFNGWISFIQKSVQYGLCYSNRQETDSCVSMTAGKLAWLSEGEVGFECQSCIFILVCLSLKQMNTLNHLNGKRNRMPVFHDFQSIMKLIVWLNQTNIGSMQHLFTCLAHSDIGNKFERWYYKLSQETYSINRKEVQCQNIKCDTRRVDTKDSKLFKCKNCKVVRYCSRKCQKYDWNKNNHKYYCYKLKQKIKIKTTLFA